MLRGMPVMPQAKYDYDNPWNCGTWGGKWWAMVSDSKKDEG